MSCGADGFAANLGERADHDMLAGGPFGLIWRNRQIGEKATIACVADDNQPNLVAEDK
jgi:hypothetical protein